MVTKSLATRPTMGWMLKISRALHAYYSVKAKLSFSYTDKTNQQYDFSPSLVTTLVNLFKSLTPFPTQSPRHEVLMNRVVQDWRLAIKFIRSFRFSHVVRIVKKQINLRITHIFIEKWKKNREIGRSTNISCRLNACPAYCVWTSFHVHVPIFFPRHSRFLPVLTSDFSARGLENRCRPSATDEHAASSTDTGPNMRPVGGGRHSSWTVTGYRTDSVPVGRRNTGHGYQSRGYLALLCTTTGIFLARDHATSRTNSTRFFSLSHRPPIRPRHLSVDRGNAPVPTATGRPTDNDKLKR